MRDTDLPPPAAVDPTALFVDRYRHLAETGLLAALLAAGVAATPAAASVLIYRSITWLGLSLLGWAVYAFLDSYRSAPPPPPPPPPLARAHPCMKPVAAVIARVPDGPTKETYDYVSSADRGVLRVRPR
jgi:hypothetical protein